MGGDLLPTQNKIFYKPPLPEEAQPDIMGYMGQWGSGKTVLLGMMGLTRCIFQPGYKVFVGRADYNDLMGTTAQVFEEMLGKLPPGILIGRDKSPPMKWTLRPAFDGPESTIQFMGLKEKLGSYNCHMFLVDEADEVEEKIAREIPARVRASIPKKDDGSLLWAPDYTALYSFNPPAKTHWLYTAATGKNEKDEVIGIPWLKLYQGIPRENSLNLPKNYYDTRAAALSEDMLQRYIENQWGSVFDGQPVYREFRYMTHSRERLDYDRDLQMFRFWDFGYNRPACLWAQMTRAGTLNILREEIGNRVEIRPFALRCIRITNTEFWNHTQVLDAPLPDGELPACTDYGDPAVRQKKDTGSTLAELMKVGIVMRFRTDKPKIRDTLVMSRDIFRRLSDDGEPAILIDRKKCPVFIEALKGGYRLADDGETPVKDGFYEHVCDAFRYGIVNLQGHVSSYSLSSGNTIPDSLEYDSRFDTVKT